MNTFKLILFFFCFSLSFFEGYGQSDDGYNDKGDVSTIIVLPNSEEVIPLEELGGSLRISTNHTINAFQSRTDREGNKETKSVCFNSTSCCFVIQLDSLMIENTSNDTIRVQYWQTLNCLNGDSGTTATDALIGLFVFIAFVGTCFLISRTNAFGACCKNSMAVDSYTEVEMTNNKESSEQSLMDHNNNNNKNEGDNDV